MKIAQSIYRLRILPRWVIIFIDLTVILVSTGLGYLLRFNFDLSEINDFNPVRGFIASVVAGLIATTITKSYAGIVRYTGVEDGIRLANTTFLSLLIVCMTNLVYYYGVSRNLIPYSVILISFPVTFFFLFFYRLIVKTVFASIKGQKEKRSNIVVFGAGQLGLAVKQIVDSNSAGKIKVVAFLEEDVRKVGNEMQGTKIFSLDDFRTVVRTYDVEELIIASKNVSFEKKNKLVDMCLERHIKVRMVPPVEKWVRGELNLRQIKEINIEDLLGREAIVIENQLLKADLSGKIVCITGAAGSIGSELSRQLMLYAPSVLVLIDQAESPLFEIETELKKNQSRTKVLVFVADISNKNRIDSIFRECKPQIIFHAAAYKHVPMMEGNPSEAVTTNVLGTKILADLAIEHGAERFVMISTDKAVNPTSVMGCTKRIAEIYVQTLNERAEALPNSQTSFVTTRFGNVLGSNGSVIPLFKKQIDNGGPLTVTHPEITRYFMTISEACRLVLEAGVMGNGGEIFIFDMGKPIRIYELAQRMIRLSGLEPDKDIEIVFTGLREGEKLFEELLADKENTIPTHHEKILKAKNSTNYSYDDVNNLIELFEDLVGDRNELKMVALMKEVVPEFKSNYSRYQVLDH